MSTVPILVTLVSLGVMSFAVLVLSGLISFDSQQSPEEKARQAKQEIRRIHRQAREEMLRTYIRRTGQYPPGMMPGRANVGHAYPPGEVIEGEVVERKPHRWRF